jgi:hypothetical protein
VILDKVLKEVKERRIKDLKRDIFGYGDDVDYYDNKNNNRGINTTNRIFYPEVLDNYWDKNS